MVVYQYRNPFIDIHNTFMYDGRMGSTLRINDEVD